jgi:hypothetical protein
MKRIFKGWIPTVSGQLSFGAFGHDSSRHEAVRTNVADDSDRYVICYQMRNLSDAPIPILAPDIDGRLWFLCLAQSETFDGRPKERLVGQLLIFDQHKNFKNCLESVVNSARERLDSFSPSNGQTLREHYEQYFETVKNEVRAYCSCCIEFTLLRSGTCTLTFDDSAKVVTGAPGGATDAGMVHPIVSQAFFFLRDVGHAHQHHSPSTDTILDVYPVKDDTDDLVWRAKTLYALYRKIISYKRQPESELFYSSLGILSYAESFRINSERELKSEDREKLPKYNGDQMRGSIQAIQAAQSKLLADRQRRMDIIRTTMFSVIGMILALVSAIRLTDFKVDGDPSWILRAAADLIVVKTGESLAFGVLLLFLVLLTSGHWRVEFSMIVTKIVPLLQKAPKWAAIMVAIIFALVWFVIFLSIIFSTNGF